MLKEFPTPEQVIDGTVDIDQLAQEPAEPETTNPFAEWNKLTRTGECDVALLMNPAMINSLATIERARKVKQDRELKDIDANYISYDDLNFLLHKMVDEIKAFWGESDESGVLQFGDRLDEYLRVNLPKYYRSIQI